MRLLISSAVHDAPEILADQARNIAAFVPGATMLVHVSGSSEVPFEDFEDAVRGLDHVVLNPTRMPTVWGDIIGPHILNLKFAHTLGDFDRFSISSSQELLIKQGLIERLELFDAGYDHEKVFCKQSSGAFFDMLRSDSDMQNLYEHIGAKQFVWSQVDGSFYPWGFAKEVVTLCDRFLDVSSKTRGYFREEVVFQTVFQSLYGNAKKCYPYVLRLAAFNYWYQERVREQVDCEILLGVIRRVVRLRYPRFFTMKLYRKVKDGRLESWRKYEMIRGRRHCDLDGVFGIKRVNGVINDPVRAAIRDSSDVKTCSNF